jgi:hypothetical protein
VMCPFEGILELVADPLQFLFGHGAAFGHRLEARASGVPNEELIEGDHAAKYARMPLRGSRRRRFRV